MGIESISKIWNEWNIGECIGEGSFGKVYRAEKTVAGFTTPAAIKVISIPTSNAELDALRSEGMSISESKEYFEDVVMGFVNEIKLMSELKGAPNIVNVEDYSILEKENTVGWDIFIRMELLQSFKNYLDTHTPSEDEVIKLGCDIATALEICHSKHIIHRDIKPANIFIDNYGNFKLGDFGIAKELEKTSGAVSSKGTFTYMAPEVARGQRYDSTVDIYSLGLVMYSLLNNNRPPFIDPTAAKVTYNDRKEANDRRLAGEPLPPPRYASPGLSQIIMMACSHDPKARFKSISAFKNALLSCKNTRSIPKSKENLSGLEETVALPKRPTASKNTVANPFPTYTDTVEQEELKKYSTILNDSNDAEDPHEKKQKSIFSTIITIFFVTALICCTIFVGCKWYSINNESGISDGIEWEYSFGKLTLSPNKLDDNNTLEFTQDEWGRYFGSVDTLEIKYGIKYIDESTFSNFSALESVKLPGSVTSIGPYAFASCKALKEISIPDTVTFIDTNAFDNTDVTIIAVSGSYAIEYAKENGIDYKIS